MKIIFQVDGGIGKNVAATAICKAIKKQCPCLPDPNYMPAYCL